jgi:uncharacterized protein YbbK (DUF523 family)
LPTALTATIEDARIGVVTADGEVPQPELYLVSACLLGVACRFDGKSNPVPELNDVVTKGLAVPICPEVAGGLPTPRLPAEIEKAAAGLDGGAVIEGRTRIVRSDGVDVTPQFIKGAEAALALARRLGIGRAILKADSPSCGAGRIHEGRFEGKLVPGDGVTAALLKLNGIQVTTERDLRGEAR